MWFTNSKAAFHHRGGGANALGRGTALGSFVAAGALVGGLVSVTSPATASASHFNTDPYTTGCAANSFTLSSKSVSGGTVSILYSRTCATNWVVYKGISQTTSKTGKDHATNKWTRLETDTGTWSYSMQSYAPGTTAYTGQIKVGSTTTTGTCSTTCAWSATTSGTPASTREARAVAWARSMIGSGAFRGLCERFVENAFGTSGRYASALAAYQALRAAGQIKTTKTGIPAGALVFSDGPADGPYGHVMLSEGGGSYISGGMITGPSVQRLSTPNPGSTFLGWAMAPSSWPGR